MGGRFFAQHNETIPPDSGTLISCPFTEECRSRPGVAIAAAAKLTDEHGVPVLTTARRLSTAARLRRLEIDSQDEEDVVLVGIQVPPGYLPAPLPGLRVTGVAQTSQVALFPFSVPAVAGLPPEFYDETDDGDICIVDGDRGRVLVSPDAETLARYQAPQRAVARVFLDPVHLPARTNSGGTVQVIAQTIDIPDVQDAVDSGADGLYLPADNVLVGPDGQTAGEQFLLLRDVLQMAAGKSVFVHVAPECVALSALGRAAAFGSLSLVLDGPERRAEMETELRDLAAEWDEDDVAFGSVSVEIAPPGVLCVGESETDAVRRAVMGGAGGVIVLPRNVGQIKAFVGSL